MRKTFLGFLVLMGGMVLILGVGLAQDKTIPKELIQYVRDARKAGLQDDQIQQNAVKAGWPAAAVGEAIKNPAGDAKPASSDPPAATAPAGSNSPAATWDPTNNPSPANMTRPNSGA